MQYTYCNGQKQHMLKLLLFIITVCIFILIKLLQNVKTHKCRVQRFDSVGVQSHC